MKKVALRPNLFIKAIQVKKKKSQGMTSLIIFLIIEIKLNIAFFMATFIFIAKNSSNTYIKTIKTIFYSLKGLIN